MPPPGHRPPRPLAARSRREDRQPPKERLSRWREQIVAPADSLTQRLLADGQVTGRGPRQIQLRAQSLAQVTEGKRSKLGGAQFDGQRQTIHPLAEGGHLIRGKRQIVADGGGAAREERGSVGQRQRFERQTLFGA